jgi:hypothetical protein
MLTHNRSLGRRVVATVHRHLRNYTLPPAAKAERRRDRDGLPAVDPGSSNVIAAALDWLCTAQDRSMSQDGGVARDFSLLRGWASSYPETTGYIIPTFLACMREDDKRNLRARARRMLDWLVAIQLPTGAFQGGKIDSAPLTPTTFNTGQIVLGLASGEIEFGSYGKALQSAADWLVKTQDADGAWRRYPTPFAAPGEKTYETHVAWALLEAERIMPNRGYAEAAFANLRWAMTKQHENGWLADCCLIEPAKPLTHTLGYALRGLIEGTRFHHDARLATAARRTADGLLSALAPDGFLPGRLQPDWSAAVSWACLTGTAQIAHCWHLLYLDTADERYGAAAQRANSYVRRTVRLDGPEEIRGGVKGSFPIEGDYGSFEYLNWAPKFLIDSLLIEQQIAVTRASPASRAAAQPTNR